MRRRREKREYTGNEIQLLTFTLGHETFAVNVSQVREISRVERITKVPRMPHFIEGVMNLRDQITTIVDMRKLFGTDLTLSKPEHLKIIVAEVKEHQLGLIVGVKDVIRVPPQSIHPPSRKARLGVFTSTVIRNSSIF